MNDVEVSGGESVSVGREELRPARFKNPVITEHPRVDRDQFAAAPVEVVDDAGPGDLRRRSGMLWWALLAALFAGVWAAVLADMTMRSRDLAPSEASDTVPGRLGLLALPEFAPDEESASERDAAAGPESPAEGEAEVFVPVPKAAIGPPQPPSDREPR